MHAGLTIINTFCQILLPKVEDKFLFSKASNTAVGPTHSQNYLLYWSFSPVIKRLRPKVTDIRLMPQLRMSGALLPSPPFILVLNYTRV